MKPLNYTNDPQDIAINKFAFDLFVNIANHSSQVVRIPFKNMQQELAARPEIKLSTKEVARKILTCCAEGVTGQGSILILPFFSIAEIDDARGEIQIQINEKLYDDYKAKVKEKSYQQPYTSQFKH